MKHLAQIIALSFFGLNAVQIILVIATAIIFIKIAIDRISNSTAACRIRKAYNEAEKNMWAIE